MSKPDEVSKEEMGNLTSQSTSMNDNSRVYIYSIRPENETISEIYNSNGNVKWNLNVADSNVKEGDIIYLYVTKKNNSGIEKIAPSFSGRILYKAYVKHIIKTEKLERATKKTAILNIHMIAVWASSLLTLEKLRELLTLSKILEERKKQGKLEKLTHKQLQNELEEAKKNNDIVGFNPPQSGITEISEESNRIINRYLTELENYKLDKKEFAPIEGIEPEKIETYGIHFIPKTYEERLYNEFWNAYMVFVDFQSKKSRSRNKLSGNITAHIIRKYIELVIKDNGLEGEYKVTPINAYVNGSFIEWDAMIVRSNAKEIYGYNIYDSDDVVALLEFKTGGIFASAEEALHNDLEGYKQIRKLTRNPINLGYITMREGEGRSHNYIEDTKSYFSKQKYHDCLKAFFVVNTTASVKYLYKNVYSWEEFVLSLLF